MNDILHYRLLDGVAQITFNRPDVLNALDAPLLEALDQALRQAQRDGARAGLLTGNGRAFCSGADLASLGASMDMTNPIQVRGWVHRMHEVLLRLFEMEIPWVAAVNGPAVGVGCHFALACDFVFMSQDAYFLWAFTQRGLSVDGGGTWLLPRMVGLHRAKRLALAPEKLSAQGAKELGLATAIVPADQLMKQAVELAQRLACGPTVALGLTKAAMNRGLSQTFRQTLEFEAQAQAINVQTEDVQEGIRAFLEKRAPRFQGR